MMMTMDSIFLGDAARAIALGLIALNFVFTLVILAVYLVRITNNQTLKTNLNKHVVSILFGFQLLTIYAFIEVFGRIGQPLTWRLPFLILTFVICNVSEYFMFNYQLNRYRGGV